MFINGSECSDLKPDPLPEPRPSPERPSETPAHTHPCQTPSAHGEEGPEAGLKLTSPNCPHTAPSTLAWGSHAVMLAVIPASREAGKQKEGAGRCVPVMGGSLQGP